MAITWDARVSNARSQGVVVTPIEDEFAIERAEATSGGIKLPSCFGTFVRLWSRFDQDAWQVLTASTGNEHKSRQITSYQALDALRSAVERATGAAIVYDGGGAWSSPDRWGMLLVIRHEESSDAPYTLLLHPPATEEMIMAAELVIGVSLPPTYRMLLQLSNGFGSNEFEDASVFGAGPSRADWHSVLSEDWLACQGMHEISAGWRRFNGIYSEIETTDALRFRAQQKTLVEFATTYDSCLMDTAEQLSDGEFPILMWDHEMADTSHRFESLSSWLEEEFLTYIANED